MPSTIPSPLQLTIDNLVREFAQIPRERRPLIDQLTSFIRDKSRRRELVLLNFICTHNSRRSHLSQIWAQTASQYYGIKDVRAFSGGTEATAFNPRAVKAMRDAGFQITVKKDGQNPEYEVSYAGDAPPLIVFSKRYDHPTNPKNDFAAIMTCSHADENCPLIIGAAKRIALTYNDPKDFDGTPLEATKYAERVREIGREILYAFSQVQ
ncbi:MAG TPA: protein-tyrosine-phosphatase [Chryseosolibacter sp.]|nr:protein-tyrosine-phosphatase [Chryseosolibacter sp.]